MDATIFLKKEKNVHENIKTLPSKVSYLWQSGFFFSAAPTAQNNPELKIHIRNVAQDTSVYYCGLAFRIMSLLNVDA